MSEKAFEMIKLVMQSTIIDDNGNVHLHVDPGKCFYCDKEPYGDVPLKFKQQNKEFLVKVPICSKHLKVLDQDDYNLKM